MYERGGPGGALTLHSTSDPVHGRCGDLPLQGKIPMEDSSARENSHGRTGNWPRDLMLSSQKVWPPNHEAGLDITFVEESPHAAFLQPEAWEFRGKVNNYTPLTDQLHGSGFLLRTLWSPNGRRNPRLSKAPAFITVFRITCRPRFPYRHHIFLCPSFRGGARFCGAWRF
jgi:hypothetical protein